MRAIGIERRAEPESTIADKGFQNAGAAAFFRKDDPDMLIAEVGEGSGQAGGIRHLLSGESLNRHGFKPVIPAEVAERRVSGGENSLSLGDPCDLAADPPIEVIELVSVDHRPSPIGIGMIGV